MYHGNIDFSNRTLTGIWLAEEFQLAKINDSNSEMPKFSSDGIEQFGDFEELRKLIER